MSRRFVLLWLAALLAFLPGAALLPIASAQPAPPAAGPTPVREYELRVSGRPDRARNVAVETSGVLAGNAHVFVTPPAGIRQVRYFVDPSEAQLESSAVAGVPFAVAERPPFDLNGADAAGRARAFDTRSLTDGPHAIVAAIDLVDGSTVVEIARVRVHNGPRALLFAAEPVRFSVPSGSRGSKAVRLLTSDGKPADYTLSASAPWVSFDAERPGANGRKGSAPSYHTVEVDTAGLSPGTYEATITATGDGVAPATTQVTMEVAALAACSPLACSEILVAAPYTLSFNQNHGKILDRAGVGTGFTYVDQPTNGTGYLPGNLAMNTSGAGTLNVTTTNGIMYTTANSQDNALAIGVDAPDQISILETTLLNPPVGTGSYEQAGLWFGNDQDNYLKLEVLSEPGATRIEYLYELAGARSGSFATAAMTLSSSRVGLRLRANPSDRTITAYYSINGGSLVQVGQFVVPGEFFSFDAAGIDPSIGTRSFSGVFATNRNSATPVVYSFDDFSLTAEAAPPPPTDTTFTRSTFPVPNPTSMVWGPDNKLYVTEMFGTIHQITFDSSKQVVSNVAITTLGQRLALGITVDPASTPGNVILYVSHSSPSMDAQGNFTGELNSSTVTRLSGANFATRQDVITGLPRAYANHAINSIHFGPDGKLYIALGGNTGAGAPNTANTEFGTRAEQPLSAAFLVADVKAAGFDGTCATPENTFGPSPCSVTTFATGTRNMYDFAFHSNGQIYGPDNGLGVTGTYPPSPTPPCTGFGDPTTWTQGGDNPGPQADILVRLQPGKYYGHPNPYRNECVFKNGSYQGVAPLANYEPPIYTLGTNRSANGTIEYRAGAFNGTLRGELLITNYSVGDDVTRVRLSSDGLSVVSARQLAAGFNDPLPIVEDPDGTLYVGELGAQRVTVLVPTVSTAPTPTPTTTPATPGPTATATPAPEGTWTTKAPLPIPLLDPGGAELNGKLYVVAGKTTNDVPQKAMYIYDPATNSWTQGPSLPAAYPAVENPAVVSYAGKLYAFTGSTLPFSGAVANSAVYDPGTNVWSSLANIPTPRGGAAAQFIGTKIYVVGGMNDSGASVTTVEIYDPATNTWAAGPAMGTARDNPGSAVLAGKLYVFGGRTRLANGTEVQPTLITTEMFDPGTNSWTPKASMPTGRRTPGVGLLNGRAQVMGGERTPTGGTFPQNEEYDPVTDSWRTLTPMLTPRHGMAAATINGVVYTAGGGPAGGSSFSVVNHAFTLSPNTITPTPTATTAPSTATPTATATTTSTPTPTGVVPTATSTSTPTPTGVVPTATSTPTPTPTVVAPTATSTPTPTPTSGAPTATRTPTITPVPTPDTLQIRRAEYRTNRRELRVDVSSSAGAGATLTVYVTSTGQTIGVLQWNGSNHAGRFPWPSNPGNITVRSSLGGVATAQVQLR